MTYKVLNEATGKVPFQSCIKYADISPHRRIFEYDLQPRCETTAKAEATAEAEAGGNTGLITEGKRLPEIVQGHERPMAMIDADDLIGRTYLADPNNKGTRPRMKIIELITLNEQDRSNDPSMICFKAVKSDETYEEIVEYHTILYHI